ncbi:6,7-dimethyl-8-ribityllumazine synthase [Corynebacterium gerontici]|uniref:6,7-dimethyl-8-ribityllumazine synthase n=1 Tax=Corynebacterium gerontici TaxID=2079234 RepID=A0A3G6J124_9CORY|nr:6,7-dimethyl-8-ribityllumazine synthase [Corynebacterium gerontici]AZA11493.1 6,7-dimethyl-8-ribityllumazine synthase [Corynebacterium gerontici]
MAVAGLPTVENFQAPGYTVGIVTATWNERICDQLHARAVATAHDAGARVVEARVMGALELPVVVQKLSDTCDAVVALGCVIRGGTPHFDYVCDSVTQGLTRLALDTRTPIGNGVLTCNDDQQAVDRAGFEGSAEDKGAEAVIAALHTAKVLEKLPR